MYSFDLFVHRQWHLKWLEMKITFIRRGKPEKLFQSFLPAGNACVEMREAPGCFSYFAADFLKLARIFLDQGNFSWTLKTGTMTELLFFKTSFEDGFKVNWLAWKQVSSSKWCSNATILLHFIQHFKIFCTDFHNLWFSSVAYLLGCFHTYYTVHSKQIQCICVYFSLWGRPFASGRTTVYTLSICGFTCESKKE